LPIERTRIGFQSKLGPVPWLGPATGDVLQDLAREGVKQVLCVPLSFTADCLETIEEIGIQYADEFARASNGGRLVRVAANNDDGWFLDALVGLVRRGVHRIAPGTRPKTLFPPRASGVSRRRSSPSASQSSASRRSVASRRPPSSPLRRPPTTSSRP
jgi:hypothetical protein